MPVFVKSLCTVFQPRRILSRETVGRILSTGVAGYAGASLTWLTGLGDSPRTPTSTDTSSGSPALACACHCHCVSGGLLIACLTHSGSVGSRSSSTMSALNIPERQILCQFPDDPTFTLHHRVLFVRIRDALWVVGTPDYEVGVRDLGAYPERVTHLVRAFHCGCRSNLYLPG